MTSKKAAIRKIKDIMSDIFMVLAVIFTIYIIVNGVEARKNDKPFYIFDHRILFVETGSMEPYMLINSASITRKVESIDELEVGDVITFALENELGELVRITHRLTSIDNGIMYTKGDNNPSGDNIPLTIENVESKVICVFNFIPKVISTWQSTSGKVIILSFVGMIILAFSAIRILIKSKREEKEVTYELMEVYYDLANELGKTPRELFESDLERHQDEVKALKALPDKGKSDTSENGIVSETGSETENH